jgi:hypothetical protein
MRRAFLLLVFVVVPAAAYDHPLGSHAIREAYFFGSGDQYAEVLAIYTKNLPVPKTGPHVAQIEVRTPYAQVIVMSHEHSVGYSAQSAAQDYKKSPDTVQVRIQILATATFAFATPAPPGPDLPIKGRVFPLSACEGELRMHSVELCSGIFDSSSARGRRSNQNRPTGYRSTLTPS